MPNSSSCRLNGIFTDVDGQDFLKICIVSVPEKGKANKELINFLAKKLGIAKSSCRIVSGELDRYKKIKIIGDTPCLAQKLDEWVAGEQ